MKLLLDQGLGRLTAAYLRSGGVECSHVAELAMQRATDAAIVELAEREGLTIITLDADFQSILSVRGARLPSVVRIRIEGLKSQAVAEIIQTVLGNFSAELEAGAFVTVTASEMRVHRLPILRK